MHMGGQASNPKPQSQLNHNHNHPLIYLHGVAIPQEIVLAYLAI